MKHGENHVITGNAIVVWDGITKPETMKNGQPMAKPQFSLKLALQPNDPSVGMDKAMVEIYSERPTTGTKLVATGNSLANRVFGVTQ